MPDVQYDPVAPAGDEVGRRRMRLPMRILTSTTENKPLKSNVSNPLGDDEPRVSAFVRVTPKATRDQSLATQSTTWRSADDITSSETQKLSQLSPGANAGQLQHSEHVWSPPGGRRQLSCDRVRGARVQQVGANSRTQWKRPIVTTCTPDLVRSTVGFRPIRRDSQDESDSSASVSGGLGDSGSGYEHATVRRNVAYKPQPATNTTMQIPSFQTAASQLQGNSRTQGIEHQPIARPKPWVSAAPTQHPQAPQWQPQPRQQQQQYQLQSEALTPSRLAYNRVSASSGGSASSYDNVDRPATPSYAQPTSTVRRQNVPETQATEGRGRTTRHRPPSWNLVSLAPPIASAAAAAAEANRRRRYPDETALMSPELQANVKREESPVTVAPIAPVHRLPRVNTWSSPTNEDAANKVSDATTMPPSLRHRNSITSLAGNAVQPSPQFGFGQTGSAIAAWRLQTGNAGTVSNTAGGASGHSRVVAPHMLGVYDPPKATMSRLKFVSSDAADVAAGNLSTAPDAVVFDVSLLPNQMSAASTTVASPPISSSISNSVFATNPPTVHGPKTAVSDSSQPRDWRETTLNKSVAEIEKSEADGIVRKLDIESSQQETAVENIPDDDEAGSLECADETESESETHSCDVEEELVALNDEEKVEMRLETSNEEEEDEESTEQTGNEEHDDDYDETGKKSTHITPENSERSSRSSYSSSNDELKVVSPSRIEELETELVSTADKAKSESGTSSSSSSSSSCGISPEIEADTRPGSLILTMEHGLSDKPVSHQLHLTSTDADVGRTTMTDVTNENDSDDVGRESKFSNDDYSDADRFGGSKEDILGLMSLISQNKIVAECTVGGTVADRVQLHGRIQSSTAGESATSSGKRPGRIDTDRYNKLLSGDRRTAQAMHDNDGGSSSHAIKSTSWTDDAPLVEARRPSTTEGGLTAQKPEVGSAPSATELTNAPDDTAANIADKKPMGSNDGIVTSGASLSSHDMSVDPAIANKLSAIPSGTVGSVMERFKVGSGGSSSSSISKSENPGYSSTSHVIRTFAIPVKTNSASFGESGSASAGTVAARIQAILHPVEKPKLPLLIGNRTRIDSTSTLSDKSPDKLMSLADTVKSMASNDAAAATSVGVDLKSTDDNQQPSPSDAKSLHKQEAIKHLPLMSSSSIVATQGDTAAERNNSEVQSLPPSSPAAATATATTDVAVSNSDGSHPSTQTTVDTLVLCKPLLTKIVASSSSTQQAVAAAAPTPTDKQSTPSSLQSSQQSIQTTSESLTQTVASAQEPTTTEAIKSPALVKKPPWSPTSTGGGTNSGVTVQSQTAPSRTVPSPSTSVSCHITDADVTAASPKRLVPLASSPSSSAAVKTNIGDTVTVCVLARLSPAAPSTPTSVTPTARRVDIPLLSPPAASPMDRRLTQVSANCPQNAANSSFAVASMSPSENRSVTIVGTPPTMSPRWKETTPILTYAVKLSPLDGKPHVRSPPVPRSPNSSTRPKETSTAFPYPPLPMPSGQPSTAVATSVTSPLAAVVDKQREFALHPSTNRLISEGSTAMAALDNALAVLTSVVKENQTEPALAVPRVGDDKMDVERSRPAAFENSQQAEPKVTATTITMTATGERSAVAELPVPERRSTQQQQQPTPQIVSSNLPSRFVIDSSHLLVRRMAPPDVVAGAEEGDRRRREIEAAENRRRRWYESHGKPDEDSFNRKDPDDESQHSASPTPPQQLPAMAKYHNMLPLPTDSVILQHRRRARKQKKVNRTLDTASGGRLAASAAVDAGSVEFGGEPDDDSTTSTSSSDSENMTSSASNRRTSYRRRIANMQKTIDFTGGCQSVPSRSLRRSNQLLASTESVDHLRRRPAVSYQTELMDYNTTQQHRSNTDVWKAVPATLTVTGARCTSASSTALGRDAGRNRSRNAASFERPLVASSANDYRQRIDYG